MNVRETIIYVVTVVIFVGCANTQPKMEHTQLDIDKKELLALNNSYRNGEIQVDEYIKEARVLNTKIYAQEKALD